MSDTTPDAVPGGDAKAEELERALRRAAGERRDQAEIAADDEGASATAEQEETSEP